MKISFIKIKSLLGKIGGFFRVNPHKHWQALLYFSSSVVVLLILFSLYLLYEIKNEQIFQVKVDSETKETLLKESSLNNVINTFDNKGTKEKIIIESPARYKDPSI